MTLTHVPGTEPGASSGTIPRRYTVPLNFKGHPVKRFEGDEISPAETGCTKRGLQELISPVQFEDYSSSDTETDSDCHSNAGSDEETLPELDKKFRVLVPALVESIQTTIQRWIASVHYIPPPADRLAPNKRTHNAKKRLRIVYSQDSNQTNSNVLSPVDGHYHWACPIYKMDPQNHLECLQKYHFRRIEDIISHIWRRHQQRYYCPICFDTFDSAMERDDHTRHRTCKIRSPQHVDGITITQRDRIRKRDKLYLPERRRWLRIWDAIFPGFEPPESPFLDRGIEQEVCIMRDFWTVEGLAIVSKYLQDRDLLDMEPSNRASVVSILSGMALETMISTRIQKSLVEGADDESVVAETSNQANHVAPPRPATKFPLSPGIPQASTLAGSITQATKSGDFMFYDRL